MQRNKLIQKGEDVNASLIYFETRNKERAASKYNSLLSDYTNNLHGFCLVIIMALEEICLLLSLTRLFLMEPATWASSPPLPPTPLVRASGL